jgi:hypothetical protein
MILVTILDVVGSSAIRAELEEGMGLLSAAMPVPQGPRLPAQNSVTTIRMLFTTPILVKALPHLLQREEFAAIGSGLQVCNI